MNGGAVELVSVPAGRVTLSDRRTQRSWPVRVATFQLAAFPVTEELYRRVTGGAPPTAGHRRHPVASVSWWDAVRFCNALSVAEDLTPVYRYAAAGGIDLDATADGYRLPAEAEWEHACRAGTTGPRYGPLDDIAWYRDNSAERCHDVGGKQPNAWGLYDMLGNVWDWCWDRYDPEVYGDYRVLRGGGWFDEHWSCRASVRRRSHPDLAIDDVGFRVARSM
ncbi:formylglycine-generating enzyme family protein [Krasilnikovia sp. MM14-A1004]|uniref:formylglycine-generating enzyme family protein n=1 Tax=Krasilnikovia sp. MM14-A1004 TaxID=3373541 RepID=UPI00399CF702